MNDEHKIYEEIKDRAEDIKAKAKEAEMSLEDALKPLMDGFEAFAKDAKEAFSEMNSKVSKDWAEVRAETETTVKENPMIAILAAAGVGLLLGLLGSRRR